MLWEWHAAFDGRVEYDFETECVLVLLGKGIDELGYGRMPYTAGEIRAHRVSWAIANGPIPEGLHVLHSCDVRRCVNPFHLSVGTHQDNMDDMAAKGRANCPVMLGTDNPNSVFTEDDVWAIRHMLLLKLYSQAEIARSYKMSPMAVSRIAQGKSWPHVTPTWPFETEKPTPWNEASILALLPPPLRKLREKSPEPQRAEKTLSSSQDMLIWQQLWKLVETSCRNTGSQ